ncbi:MAG: diaminopimelate decarboxylase [Candidatus Marinimicrobia bacterium]|nr:diaminopimelate decarboxylase [Candidatus Neomarinimicrobiota bacterium]
MHPLRKLIFDEKLLSPLAKTYGTPLYIYSQERITENVLNLKNALNKHFEKFHICYAIKSNSNPHLIKTMREAFPKIGGDCSSPGEIYAAELSGIDPSDCIYTGNYESPSDLKKALTKQCNINLDDITSLNRIKKIGLPKRISFRMNPGFGGGSYSGIVTGGRDAKFGIPAEKITVAYKQAQDLGIQRFGLQCMCGSGNLDESFFKEVLSAILENAQRIESELKINFEFISMGGGFGVPYQDDQKPLDFDHMFGALSDIYYKTYTRRESAPSLWLEPGKSIIADAGFIVSKVTGLKESYKNFIGIDAGMETLMRPALYGAKHRIYKVGNHSSDTVMVDFTGQICENTDRIASDRDFPDVSEGDLIAIMDTGAYGYSMSHNFNTRPRSAEILINNNSHKLIRKRETINDIFSLCDV